MSCSLFQEQPEVAGDHFVGYSEIAALPEVVPRDTMVPFLLKPWTSIVWYHGGVEPGSEVMHCWDWSNFGRTCLDVVNLYLCKLLAWSYDKEFGVAVIKLKEVLRHPRFDIRYALFYYKDCVF